MNNCSKELLRLKKYYQVIKKMNKQEMLDYKVKLLQQFSEMTFVNIAMKKDTEHMLALLKYHLKKQELNVIFVMNFLIQHQIAHKNLNTRRVSFNNNMINTERTWA